MTDTRRAIIAALVTAAMPLITIGLPMAVSAAHVGGDDQTTHYFYSEGSR